MSIENLHKIGMLISAIFCILIGTMGMAQSAASEPIFIDLPAIETTLSHDASSHKRLSARIAVQVESETDAEVIRECRTELNAAVLERLKILRSTDLHGAAGLFALRDDLLVVMRRLVPPDMISDILFKELLIE